MKRKEYRLNRKVMYLFTSLLISVSLIFLQINKATSVEASTDVSLKQTRHPVNPLDPTEPFTPLRPRDLPKNPELEQEEKNTVHTPPKSSSSSTLPVIPNIIISSRPVSYLQRKKVSTLIDFDLSNQPITSANSPKPQPSSDGSPPDNAPQTITGKIFSSLSGTLIFGLKKP
ncbi:hypothetical protein ACWOFR_07300 [Carnobacterium gallinarum]|uniref:hypothetical protein n=1 Tax=Carnobacterium gallinarum TaxID=2749 RepID=UPI00054FF9FD|nr:hypothetical protein [Carnobacterium gallinarum]